MVWTLEQGWTVCCSNLTSHSGWSIKDQEKDISQSIQSTQLPLQSKSLLNPSWGILNSLFCCFSASSSLLVGISIYFFSLPEYWKKITSKNPRNLHNFKWIRNHKCFMWKCVKGIKLYLKRTKEQICFYFWLISFFSKMRLNFCLQMLKMTKQSAFVCTLYYCQ